MKKILSALLAFCLLVSVLPMAMAASLEKVGTLETEDYRVVDGQDLLRNIAGDGDQLCALDGTVLADIPGAHYYSEGDVLIVKVEGRNGLVTLDGTQIVPLEYDLVQAKGDWAMAYIFAESTESDYDVKVFILGTGTHAFMIYDTIALYSISKNTLVRTFTREECSDWSAQGEYINIQDRSGNITCYDGDLKPVDYSTRWTTDFGYLPAGWQKIKNEETGLRGIADDNGNVMIPTEYKWIDESYGWFQLTDDAGKIGLADPTGKIMAAPGYERFEAVSVLGGERTYGVNGIVCGENADGTYALIDTKTGETAVVDGSDAEFLGTVLLVKEDGGRVLVNAKGIRTQLNAKYERVNTVTLNAGSFLIAVYADGSDLLDENGTVLISGNRVEVTPGGYVLVGNDGNTDLYVLK